MYGGLLLTAGEVKVADRKQEALARVASDGREAAERLRRRYSVRPSKRKLRRSRQRNLQRRAQSDPVDTQFSLGRLFWITTLVCISLGGIMLGRSSPLGQFMFAASIVALIAVMPPAWWRMGNAMLALIGGAIFILVCGALLVWIVSPA